VCERRPPKPTMSVVIPALNEGDNPSLVVAWPERKVHQVLSADGLSKDKICDIARVLHQRSRTPPQRDSGYAEAPRIGLAVAAGGGTRGQFSLALALQEIRGGAAGTETTAARAQAGSSSS
jgi:hypothetical protein